MSLKQIVYVALVFVLSLLMHATSLFIVARLFNRGPKKHGFRKALNVLLHVYLSILIMWFVGQLVIWLLIKLGVGGGATSMLVQIVMLVVFVLSLLYYFKELKSRYSIGNFKTISLIVVTWLLNLAILYLVDRFISPYLYSFKIPLLDFFFGYWLPFF